MLYDLSAPGRVSVQPLFADFAQRLIVDQPDDVTAAYAPVIEYIASIVRDAGRGPISCGPDGRTASPRSCCRPRRSPPAAPSGGQPIRGDEVWEFCLHAIVPDDVLEPT